jgi:hypothetical protein
MTSFALEIHGSGPSVRLEPVGTIDLAGAKVLLEALSAMRAIAQAAFVEIRLDRVVGLTKSAWRLLAAGELPAAQLAAVPTA